MIGNIALSTLGVIVVTAVSSITTTGCVRAVDHTATQPLGCHDAHVTAWATMRPSDSKVTVSVAVPQVAGWQEDADLATQVITSLGRYAQEAAPAAALVLLGPQPESGHTQLTFMAGIFALKDAVKALDAASYLADEVRDYADALSASGDRLYQQAETTVCQYPARSYLTVDANPPPGKDPVTVFNVRVLVTVGESSYEIQFSYGPHQPETSEPDPDAILAGLRITTDTND